MQSTLTLVQGMNFDTELGGHHFPMDAKAEHGGKDLGPSPKGLVLSALAGCAAMDVISILRKMRAEPDSLTVSAEGTPTESHPKVLVDLVVTVRATGGVPVKKLWRAVELSRDTYCGVAAMLRAHTPITYRVFLDGEEVAEPIA